VVQRGRAFRYKGASIDVQEAGRELQVEAILTGRLLLRGDTLIIKMELVDIERDAQLWGQQYTKRLSDIFALQEEIADQVSETLKLRLAAEPKKRGVRQTENLEAYQLYLKGRFFWARFTPENIRKAIDFYQEAITKDPNFARAYSGLADCYSLMGSSAFGTVRAAEILPKARAAAEKALTLDASLAETYTSLGICALYDWDWTAAERAIRRSLELDPESVGAHNIYCQYFMVVGRPDDSIREARRAAEINPLSNAPSWLGTALVFARKYDEAIIAANNAIELNPTFLPPYLALCFAYHGKGELSKAIEYAEKAVSLARLPLTLSLQGWIYELAGRHNDAIRVLQELQELARHTYVAPIHIATIYAAMGDVEAWRKAMWESYEDRSPGLVFLKLFPHFEPMRSDPVFQELVRKIGLP
jgi:tetratricopeptide (TPR) repeat protein